MSVSAPISGFAPRSGRSPSDGSSKTPQEATTPIIVLEGIDGAGTTTQARLLVERLAKNDIVCHKTRQPSDGFIGKLIRRILSKEISACSETIALLYAADRTEHYQAEVAPALARGEWVISDRWYHSSLAYQGTLKGLPNVADSMEWIREINRCARVPTLTIFVDVTVEEAAKRRAQAGRPHELFDDDEVQHRVRTGYHRAIVSLSESENILTLNGERPSEEVAKDIFQAVKGLG